MFIKLRIQRAFWQLYSVKKEYDLSLAIIYFLLVLVISALMGMYILFCYAVAFSIIHNYILAGAILLFKYYFLINFVIPFNKYHETYKNKKVPKIKKKDFVVLDNVLPDNFNIVFSTKISFFREVYVIEELKIFYKDILIKPSFSIYRQFYNKIRKKIIIKNIESLKEKCGKTEKIKEKEKQTENDMNRKFLELLISDISSRKEL